MRNNGEYYLPSVRRSVSERSLFATAYLPHLSHTAHAHRFVSKPISLAKPHYLRLGSKFCNCLFPAIFTVTGWEVIVITPDAKLAPTPKQELTA